MLRDLVEAVGDARVVALGEGAHNILEFQQLRSDLFRVLVEEAGFTALVLESGYAEGLAVDAWLRGAPGDVATVARDGIGYGFGESVVVHDMLRWMRHHNASGGGLHLYGMDLPGGATSPGPAVRACLARVPGRPGDAELIRLTDLGGRTEAAVRLESMPPARRDRLDRALRDVVDRAETDGDPIAVRAAASLRAWTEEQEFDGDGPYPRDVFMADTVRWVLAQEERVLVSAHNAHVRRTPWHARPMLGALLAPHLGSQLVVVAMTYGDGPEVRFEQRSPRPFDCTVSLADRRLSPGAVESRLDPLADPSVVVDLRTAPRDLFDGVEGTQVAGGIDPVADFPASYDVLVHLHEVHPVPGAFERLRAELESGEVAPPPYPPSRVVDVVAEPAGVRVPDPYRWLEEDSDEVLAWQQAQADLATRTVFDGQDRAWLEHLVTTHDAGARPRLPVWAAGQWFRESADPGGRPAVVVSEEPLAPGRVVLSLADLGEPDQSVFLSWLAPSPDARVLALGVCTDGTEHNTVRLVDVADGHVLDDAPTQVLHSAWAGGASWAPDSRSFWFFALTGPPERFQQALFRHRLASPGAPARTEVERVPVPEGTREYTRVQVSADGRWAVASHRVGSPVPIAVLDLTDDDGSWRLFVTRADGTLAGLVVDDHYVAVTDIGAARGRVVAIPLRSRQPDDAASWVEVLPEGETVLRGLTPVGDHLYLSELDQTFARVRVLDKAGHVVGEVPLPGRGAIAAPFFAMTGLAVGHPPPAYVYAFSTPTTSWGVYHHRPTRPDVVDVLDAPAVTLDAELRVAAAPAPDGTPVPYHVVRPGSVEPGRPAPTLLTAYGAANVATLPDYQPDLAAFVAAGGVVAQAYLRGGGELGRDWYLGAHRERRHVRDSDLVAVAEHLIAEGVTTADRLALTGGSDGGLMCGVAVTTRPDLWCAVAPRAPLLDLVGGFRDPYLEFVIRKAWGDPDDPEDVRRMLGRSPYELITRQAFPAVYLQAGANDPRCPPWQARKFAARLQAAQQGRDPILLHVFEDAGHGAATGTDVAHAQDTEWLAFLLGRLGLGRP